MASAALAYEAKGDYDHAKQDYATTLEGVASDAGSKANQATAKVRLSLLQEAAAAPENRDNDAGASRRIGPGFAVCSERPPRRAGDRQRRLYPCQGAAQSAQRCARGRQKPARHRLRRG